VEEGESECDVEHHTAKARTDTRVEAHEALLSVNLGEAVREASVLVGVNTLHLGLHDIDGVVEHGGAETGKGARQQVNDDLGLDVSTELGLSLIEDHESDTLVGGLLEDSGGDALVESGGAVLGSNSVNTVEDVAVFGFGREAVVNESSFEGLLGGDDSNSFGGTSGKTAAEVVKLALFGKDVLGGKVVNAETHGVLGHGEHEQGGVASVETFKAGLGPGLADDVHGAHFVELGVQLHDGFGVLSGESAGDFNCSDNATCSWV
jgi:hypothetical protein